MVLLFAARGLREAGLSSHSSYCRAGEVVVYYEHILPPPSVGPDGEELFNLTPPPVISVRLTARKDANSSDILYMVRGASGGCTGSLKPVAA
jgi:hypothetical protein